MMCISLYYYDDAFAMDQYLSEASTGPLNFNRLLPATLFCPLLFVHVVIWSATLIRIGFSGIEKIKIVRLNVFYVRVKL